jgi:Fe2+ or Zn2+ uptake regulation protein
MASKAHPTAEELYGSVQRLSSNGGISLATVYNALDAFTRHGLARRIAPTCAGSNAAFRYDADISNHAHVLLADGTVQDLPIDLSERIFSHLPHALVEEVERRTGIQVKRVGIEFLQAPQQGADRAAGESGRTSKQG